MVRSYLAATSSNIAATSRGSLVQAGAGHGLILADAPPGREGGRGGGADRPVVGLLAVTSSPGPDRSAAGLPAPLVARTVAVDDPGPLLSLLPATDAPDVVSLGAPRRRAWSAGDAR